MEWTTWKILEPDTEALITGGNFLGVIKKKRICVNHKLIKKLKKFKFTQDAGSKITKLALVSVAGLGFNDEARLGVICARVKEYGAQNCSPETVLRLRLQYLNQPRGEWLIVPVTDSNGTPELFFIEHAGNGLWIRMGLYDIDCIWQGRYRFVFDISNYKPRRK